jgi:hypothetical protein
MESRMAKHFHTRAYVRDADLHVREAQTALKRARDRAPSQGVHDMLDGLLRGQRNVRRVLSRVEEHLR